MEPKMSILETVANILPKLVEKFESKGPFKYFLEAREGGKYIKVCIGSNINERPTRIDSVFFFVDKTTGDVFKPAGFNAPAKGARFNIATAEGVESLLNVAAPGGGFLYIKR
jgi:hypothetical protein